MANVGLIGVGSISGLHLTAYNQLQKASVIALCDIIPERARGNEQVPLNIGGVGNTAVQAKAYLDYKELLADPEVEIVDICLPTYLHAEVTIAALEAEKHVLCEKPMALSLADCDRMIDAAERAQRMLMIGQSIRFWPEYVAMKEIVESGKYGKVLAANFRRLGTLPGRIWFHDPVLSGGCPFDLHIHDADFIHFLFGMPEGVTAQGTVDEHGISYIDTAYHYGDDRIVTAQAGWNHKGQYPFQMFFYVNLEHATLDFNWSRTPLTVYLEDGTSYVPDLSPLYGHTWEIDYFLDCIAHDTPPSIVTPMDARESVRLVLAEKEAVQSRQYVSL